MSIFENKNDDVEVEFDAENKDEFDEEETDGALTERLTKVKADLVACSKERKEYLDGWQRVKADYLNSKKRYEEERGQSIARSEVSLIEKLLPLCDSFDMALSHIEPGKGDAALAAGFSQISAQLDGILSSFGVTDVSPIGEEFDPHTHDALSSSAVDSQDQHGKVISVLQKGYRRGETLIRPAKVIIGEFTG